MPFAQAATFTWDASGVNPTLPTDGAGTWNTTGAANWSDGTTNFDWTNAADIAVLGSNNGVAGTVSLGTDIIVGGITFNNASSGNYSIAGAGNILTFGGATTASLITTNTYATISAPLALTGSVITLTKGGSGILELSGGGTVANIRSGPSTGSLFITGGTFTVNGMNSYDKGILTDDDGGMFHTGGSVISSRDWDGRFTAPYTITGGNLQVTTPNRVRGIGIFKASGDAVVNFITGDPRIASDNRSGTLSINGTASVTFSNNGLLNIINAGAGTTHTGTINLSGGTLTTAGIIYGFGAPATTSGVVNFNGGTLRANNAMGSSFFTANALMTANIYGGGAIINSNGFNVGISQPLLGTTGNGVDSAIVTDGGSGYTNAPEVTITGGGGTGATAYALINTSGTVTSIVITNPGRDYTSAPAIGFSSGSATATATAGLVNAEGGLTKTGTGTLTLNGANTYTGDTSIDNGTLRLTQPVLHDDSTVNISADGFLQLDYIGFETVAELFIDGEKMDNGDYDKDHISGSFTGNGVLRVGSIEEDTYATWETDNGITGAGADTDSDNDGISNGIEFVIGGDPSGPDSDSNSLLEPVMVDDNNLTYTFRRTSASAPYEPFVEYSSDLALWTTAEEGVNGVTITNAADFYEANIDQVTVVIPKALAASTTLFARLKVNIP